MGGIIIDLNKIAAKIELPAEFVASRMSFVEPLCATLSASRAQALRTSALRMLKVQHHIQSLPPADNAAAIAARTFLLNNLVGRSYSYTNPLLKGFKGATYEERKKACDEHERQYKGQETVLFNEKPELWWQHRVQESYEYERAMDQSNAELQLLCKKKATGCIIPIVAFLAVGWWASRLILS